jgi:transcription factor C subunit 7
MTEIHSRAKEFIDLLIAYMDDRFPDVKRVLLVSHAATVIALGRALTRDEGLEVRAGTCSLSVYRRSNDSGETGRQRDEDARWICGHLAQGEQVGLC